LLFMHRFRMSRNLFKRIADGILEHDYDGYFTQKRSASGALGLHPLQKMTATMRMLTYGIAADGADEYIWSAEATNLESCKKFVIKVCEVFGERYLRSPNEEDIARLLAIGEERGFPDGIYPRWATFVKSIPAPDTRKHKTFAKRQEGARKDVERAFGVLQSRFAIVRGPAKGWKRKEIGDVMKACVIMHNMIVEEERQTGRQSCTFEAMGERVTIS
uniref:DDE Tnp4 domain-containing protein n=1 Tax=Aegilops tauschii subsp. strangulata TaxID=200361 RepID=A0A453NS48_AEGTS